MNVLVEKYRPQHIDHVILDSVNKSITNHILDTGVFPNILMTGPPGTGKTTTANTLICAHHEQHHRSNLPRYQYQQQYILSINASDNRTLDAVKGLIQNFVTAAGQTQVYIILDEVDSFTHLAQKALSKFLNIYTGKACFVLICNYPWCLDPDLTGHFIQMQFCQLPLLETIQLLKRVSDSEKLGYSSESIHYVYNRFSPDIRSMINFMNTHTHPQKKTSHIRIVNPSDMNDSLRCICSLDPKKVHGYFQTISHYFHTDPRTYIAQLLKHVIKTRPDLIQDGQLLTDMKSILRTKSLSTGQYVEKVVLALRHSMSTK